VLQGDAGFQQRGQGLQGGNPGAAQAQRADQRPAVQPGLEAFPAQSQPGQAHQDRQKQPRARVSQGTGGGQDSPGEGRHRHFRLLEGPREGGHQRAGQHQAQPQDPGGVGQGLADSVLDGLGVLERGSQAIQGAGHGSRVFGCGDGGDAPGGYQGGAGAHGLRDLPSRQEAGQHLAQDRTA